MRVKVKVRERVRVTYTKRKSVGPENFEQVITLEFAMVFGKLDNFEYLRDRKDVLRNLPIVWKFFRRFLNHMGRVVSKLG